MRQQLIARINQFNAARPWSHNDFYYRWVLRQLPRRPSRAIDLGCGTGNLARALAARSVTVDDVTAVAVIHHLPLEPALEKARTLLRPRGTLVIIGCYRPATAADRAVGLLAVPLNMLMGLAKSRGRAAARVAMSAPVAPPGTSLAEVRAAAARVLPGARIRRRLFWRYSLRYTAAS